MDLFRSSHFLQTSSSNHSSSPSAKAMFIQEELTKLIQVDSNVKVIVFSQFRVCLDMLGTQLIKGEFTVAEFWGRYAKSELEKFTQNKVHGWECASCGFRNEDALARSCHHLQLTLKSTRVGGVDVGVIEVVCS